MFKEASEYKGHEVGELKLLARWRSSQAANRGLE